MPRAVDSYLHLPRRRYFSALELHAAIIGTIAAAVVIVGYGFGVELLQRLGPNFPTMKLRTSVVLMGLSLSYLLSLRDSQQARWASVGIAAGALILLVETALNRPPPIASLPWTIVPSFATIFCLAAISVSLLVINLRPRWSRLVSFLCFFALTPALFRIITLVLLQAAPDEDGPLNTMALHTAMLCAWMLLICILHPRLSSASILLQADLRGRVLRLALPAVIILPVSSAAASLALSVLLDWSTEALFALNAAISVTLSVILIGWLSNMIAEWQTEATERSGRLTRANEALEQYASSAAHDLKAPSRHVLLYGELLGAALDKGDIAEARRHARSIRESALEMPRMIEGMLEFSRSSFTRVALSLNSLSELVQAAAAQNAADLQAAGATVRVMSEARFQCDPTLMTTVFQNLIANAIKNRRRDRALDIRILSSHEDEGWRIAVEDNGVGFDADFTAVAFNPLARGVKTAGEGAGIGLATCRSIIQAHGGTIEVDPAFRGGARIVFFLPDADPA
jgi:signal transduction histidine kinase